MHIFNVKTNPKESLLIVKNKNKIKLQKEDMFWDILADALLHYQFEYEISKEVTDTPFGKDIGYTCIVKSEDGVYIELTFDKEESVFPEAEQLFNLEDFIHDVSYEMDLIRIGGSPDTEHIDLEDVLGTRPKFSLDSYSIEVKNDCVIFKIKVDLEV